MITPEWEEINGFQSPGEYLRFVIYINNLVSNGCVEEIEMDQSYQNRMVYGGRWFKNIISNEIWRLVPPDFPFRGLWEPVLYNINKK
jgi:hypothetical protein